MTELGHVVTRRLLLALSSTVVYRLGVLALLPVLTRQLPLEEYGRMELLYSIALLLVPVAGLSAHEAFLSRFEKDGCRALASAYRIETVGVLAAIAILIALGSTGLIQIASAVVLGAFVASNVYWQQTNAALRAMGRYGSLFFASMIQSATLLLLTIPLVSMLPTAASALSGFALAALLASLAAIRACPPLRSALAVRHLNQANTESLLRIGVLLLPNVVVWWFIEFSDRWLLAFFHGPEAVGVFAGGARVTSLLLAGILVLYQVWQPMAVAALQRPGQDEYLRQSKYYWDAATLGAGALLIAVGPQLSIWLLGERLSSAETIVSAQLFATVLMGQSYFFGIACLLPGRVGLTLWPALAAGLANLIANLVLIPEFAAAGAAASSIIAFMIMAILRYRLAVDLLGHGLLNWRVVAGLVAMLGLAIVSFHIPHGAWRWVVVLAVLLLFAPAWINGARFGAGAVMDAMSRDKPRS